jgi:NADH-quinone oxidoreductase subunit E/NADP-reducing hydrogenase subunit HndA
MQAVLEFTEQQIQQVDGLIDKYGTHPSGLVPLLEKVQEALGYLPVSIQDYISEKTRISPNRIYGVVTFYSYFTMVPRARHRVQVCLGTACYVKGADVLVSKIEKDYQIKFGESTKDGRFTFEKARCVGACGLAPVVIVDGRVFGKVSVDGLDEILEQFE